MSEYWYEILLGAKHVTPERWQELFHALRRYLGWHGCWCIYMQLEKNTLHYYLVVPIALPSSLELSHFLFKALLQPAFQPLVLRPARSLDLRNDPLPLVLHKLTRRSQQFCYLECNFQAYSKILLSSSHLITRHRHNYFSRRLLIPSPARLLSINYEENRHLRYKNIPKYLDSEKAFRLAHPVSSHSLLHVDPFPYGFADQGIELADFDFAKHSLVIGGSGSGKSQFLALFASRLYQSRAQDCKIIIIDPHDALKHQLGEVASQRIIDFHDPTRSIDLFRQDLVSPNVSVELMLETFKSLIGDNYNGRLERVLRHSIHILLLDQAFTFPNLRRLLSDTEFRSTLLSRLSSELPQGLSHFFLTEFQELRSQAYNLAIAPIMAFIDEMQMVPVMNQESTLDHLGHVIEENFLTVFSLNRLFLGDKPARVIAGLIMQQIFLYAQNRTSTQHLLVMIDEVAVVENPILTRFLSELRKYHVSVILAGQYFGQISANLRASILANTSNYYIFRVSRSDADLLSQNLQLKLIDGQTLDDEKKIFTGLKARECLVQIECQGELYSLFKASTADHHPPPNSALPVSAMMDEVAPDTTAQTLLTFTIASQYSADQIMLENSTNRKPLKSGKAV